MPTPKERNALIFLAALGALGIGARAFRGTAPAGGAAGAASRVELERQIGAVDSATAAKRTATKRTATKRTATTGRSKGRRAPAPPDTAADASSPSRRGGRRSAERVSSRRPVPAEDTVASDPMARYEARRLEVGRLNKGLQARIERDRGGARADADSAIRRVPIRRKKPVKMPPLPQRPFHP